MRTALAALALVAAAGGAHARDNTTATWGVGSQRCSEVFGAPGSESSVADWVDGYLTAAATIKGKRDHAQTASYIAFETGEVCKKNPNRRVVDVVRDLAVFR